MEKLSNPCVPDTTLSTQEASQPTTLSTQEAPQPTTLSFQEALAQRLEMLKTVVLMRQETARLAIQVAGGVEPGLLARLEGGEEDGRRVEEGEEDGRRLEGEEQGYSRARVNRRLRELKY